MSCDRYQSGDLQAYLDGELSRNERKKIALHLEHCSSCQTNLQNAKKMNDWLDMVLRESLAEKCGNSPEPDVSVAWENLQARLNEGTETKNNLKLISEEGRWVKMNNRRRKWMAGGVAAAIVASIVFVPQIQAVASDLLNLLRIDKVQTIQLSPQDLEEIRANLEKFHDGEIDLKGKGHMSVEGHHQGQTFASLEEARQAGIVGVPELQGYTIIELGQEEAFSTDMKFDVTELEELSKQLGSEIDLDSQLNNKEFTVNFPQSLYVKYQSSDDESVQLAYGKTATPQIQVPEGVDINQVRGTLLASPLFPENVRRQLANIDDWQSTLPIPYVEGKDHSEDVKINGEKGVFVVPAEGHHSAFLIWQADNSMNILTLLEDGSNGRDTKALKKVLLDVAGELD